MVVYSTKHFLSLLLTPFTKDFRYSNSIKGSIRTKVRSTAGKIKGIVNKHKESK